MPIKNASIPTKTTSPAAAQFTSSASNFPTLSDICETCALVTDHAQHVHLNHKNLKTFAKTITTPPNHWLITNPHNLLTLPLPLLTTILLYFEVIDYSFWPNPANKSSAITPTTNPPHSLRAPQKLTTPPSPSTPPKKWTIQTPSGPLDGSVALLYLLIQSFQQNPDLDFSNFSDADFYNFFHPAENPISDSDNSVNNPAEILAKNSAHNPGNPAAIPLLSARAETLRKTSHILHEQLSNNFYAAIKNFTSDEQLFHFLITTFPSFRDQRTYTLNPQNSPVATEPTSKTIHFYKLAQLLTSDLLFVRHHLESRSKNLKNISVDTSHLSGCADYKIPQALRALNLISYDEELSALVDSQRLIPENSPYEVEIRAATVSAIAFLHDELPQFSPIQINDYLFLASRNLPKKQPYHLTRNTNY